jgi:glycosyltransferase involved in cell wall biosynthesis
MQKNQKEKLIFGALGRLEEQKGFKYLIEAAHILKQQQFDFNIFIAGSGSQESLLKQQVKERNLENNISFIGWIDNLDNFFNKIDIFCLSSIDEGFGIVILESMYRNKPVIATDCEGPIDIITNEIDGLICKKKNAEELANCMKRFFFELELAEKLSKNAYKKIITKYSNQVISDQINGIISSIYSNFYSQHSNQINILNITYNSKLGGVEKVFLDFNNFLSKKYKILALLPFQSKFFLKQNKDLINNANCTYIESKFLRNSFFKFLLKIQIKRIIAKHGINIIISHNSRYLKFLKRNFKQLPIITVNHGSNPKKCLESNYIMAVNNKIVLDIIALGFDKNKIFKFDNSFKA